MLWAHCDHGPFMFRSAALSHLGTSLCGEPNLRLPPPQEHPQVAKYCTFLLPASLSGLWGHRYGLTLAGCHGELGSPSCSVAALTVAGVLPSWAPGNTPAPPSEPYSCYMAVGRLQFFWIIPFPVSNFLGPNFVFSQKKQYSISKATNWGVVCLSGSPE